MTEPGRHISLFALFTLQAFCVLFFLGDAVADVMGWEQALGVKDTDLFEYLVVIALILGLVLTGLEIRKILRRQQRMEHQIKAASGAFSDLLREHFETWSLTEAERDVALLAIKGLPVAEIARVRETKEGTVKAQCNAIYRKAGVNGRTQLLSLFVEDLMAESLIPAGH